MIFNLNKFISQHVTKRKTSLFLPDILDNLDLLESRINGRSALVIGGAGTIGSSFIRALLKYGKLAKLYVVDINENGLTELTRDIRSSNNLNVPPSYKTYPINFGDEVFKKLFEREGPFEIVANFAAHKHVRSEKDHYSIEAMVDNNVMKAKELLDILLVNPPERFFCVSTDKAANPVNIMGASKKLMEEVIMSYSTSIPITTARFANVAFSNGSLPFGFMERLSKAQPLSAPQNIKRFFVSPEESGEICMLACILGESGDMFFPKLDPETDMETFTHIGDRLLEEMGYQPIYCNSENEAREKAKNITKGEKVYPVYYFPSDTSGEKPYEEFFTKEEEIDFETFESLGVIKNTPKKSVHEIQLMFTKLKAVFEADEISKQTIVASLNEFLPNFEHIETGKSLDQKM